MSAQFSIKPSEIPAREDGGKWPFVFVDAEGRAVFADSRTDVVSQLISGYAELPVADTVDDFSLEARISSLASLAAEAQAGILASLAEEGQILSALDDDSLTALFVPKDSWPVPITSWDENIPLILLRTNFEPFTDVPEPTGEHIVWLDASTETFYFDALAALGLGELHVPG